MQSKLDWKARREIANKLIEFNDVNLPEIEWVDYDTHEQLASRVIEFFETESELEYPAKHIFVNIVYSYLMEYYFDEDFEEILMDDEFLADSPYSVPYHEYEDVYEEVLASISDIRDYESTQKTIDYFKEEFLLDENPLFESYR